MYCKHCGIGVANDDGYCWFCGKRVNPIGIDDEGFPITIYASKEVYLETHFEDYYTWACENFDIENIGEDELKKIVESAILKPLDVYTNDETIKVYPLGDDVDEFTLVIFQEIEDRLDNYFDSNK